MPYHEDSNGAARVEMDRDRQGKSPSTGVVLITGCSSGIGMHTAIQAARSGRTVWATMRDTSKKLELVRLAHLEGIEATEQTKKRNSICCSRILIDQMDVQDDKSVEESVTRLLSSEGRLDVIVHCAGSGMIGTVETCTIEEIKNHFDVNVYGPIRVIHHIMPFLRSQGHGHLIVLSSVSGLRAIPCSELYAGSKHALEGILEGFSAVAQTSGIQVTLVEPGPVRTKFLENSKRHVGRRDPGQSSGVVKDLMEKFKKFNSLRLADDALPSGEDVAEKLIQLMNMAKPPLRFQTDSYSIECAASVMADPTGNFAQSKNERFIRELMASSDQ